MELELGLKITRTKDDVSSSTDFRVSRDSFGQLSLSRETSSVFYLILHLKGFKKEGIDIEINKEGTLIKISGRKHVEEMVLVKWVEWKKERDIKEFKKVYRIPAYIVVLDKIKANFNEEDGTLTVTMPKKVKGITGLKIEEEEEEEEKTEPVEEITEDKTEPEEEIQEETKPEEEEQVEERPQGEVEEEKIEEEVMEEETKEHEEEKEEIKEEEDSKPRKKRRKKCWFPCAAGSTLLMSIIVFIIQLIQSRRK